MLAINTILVILDGCDDDATTVSHAVDIATGFGASMDLFSCVFDQFLGG